jgi:hypothetical protein
MAASLLSDAAAFALRVSFSRAMQQHAPAFLLHGPAAAPARSHRLDAAVGVLVDTAIGVIRIALWAAFLAVILLVILFASCVVAALVAIVVHLDRSRASGSRERRLAVLAFISVILLTVALPLVLVLVLILAAIDGEE